MIRVEPTEPSPVPDAEIRSICLGSWRRLTLPLLPDSDVTLASVQLISDDIKKEAESPHPPSLAWRLPASQSEEAGSSETRPDTRLSGGSPLAAVRVQFECLNVLQWSSPESRERKDLQEENSIRRDSSHFQNQNRLLSCWIVLVSSCRMFSSPAAAALHHIRKPSLI